MRWMGVVVLVAVVLAASGATVRPVLADDAEPGPEPAPLPDLPESLVPSWNECFQDVLLRGDSGELYGPTDVNAMSANGRLATGLNRSGTVTVLRYPRPSYYDQIKYRTNDRDAERFGALENAGAFLGLLVPGEGTTWLRDVETRQRYADDRSDTIEHVHEVADHGLEVVVRDTVVPRIDALVRDVTVDVVDDTALPDDVELIAFENLNTNVARLPYFPVLDWCTEELNVDTAAWHDDAGAVVHETSGLDLAAGDVRSVGMAMGFDRPAAQHQVGGDAYEGTALPFGRGSLPTVDAYDDAADGALTGNDAFTGQTTGAVTATLDLDGGRDRLRLALAGGDDGDGAVQALAAALQVAEPQAAKRAWFDGLLDDPPMPDTDDADVLALARRAVVTLASVYDPDSGAVVASIATQSPYSADWPRDGAFFNVALGLMGRDDWVATRNRWYASLQSSGAQDSVPLESLLADAPEDAVAGAEQALRDGDPTAALTALLAGTLGEVVGGTSQSLLVPPGNWAMNYYADGVTAGPIPWEIDETGYTLWAFWDHAQATGDLDTLAAVYPAVRAAADFLVDCVDPGGSGLQCPAFEDDNYVPEQSIHGAGPVWLGLDSAVKAALALDEDADAARWEGRRDELGAAIERELVHDGVYAGGNAVSTWPACLHDYDAGTADAQYEAIWEGLARSFAEPGAGGQKVRGLYESKGLIALAKATRGLDGWDERVRDGLLWVATEHAEPDTHVMGEEWIYEDGDVVSAVSQPHVWEQVLFYLASLEAWAPPEADVDGVRDCAGAIGRLRAAGSAGSPADDQRSADHGAHARGPDAGADAGSGGPARESTAHGVSPTTEGTGVLPATGSAALLPGIAALLLVWCLRRRDPRPTPAGRAR